MSADALRGMAGPGGVRETVARWVVTADLVLTTACHLGSGGGGDAVDMPLLRDRAEGLPLLTGSSLAGALRDHVADRLHGYGVEDTGEANRLFGGGRGDRGVGLSPTLDEGAQSPLIVYDALGRLPENATAEVRDGVAINPASGTADDHFKFDAEVLPPGTTFHLRFDLLVGRPSDEAGQLALLAAALAGLGRGEIGIGARQSRGLGACRARKWRVRRFDLTSRDGWLAWLGADAHHPTKGMRPHDDITATLRDAAGGRVRVEPSADRREAVRVEVELTTHGGLLVRSPGLTADVADATPLTSGGKPVLPGTSVAGALRARALRIARLVRTQNDGERWVDQLFGPGPKRERGETPFASRLRVAEQPVLDGKLLRQSRVRIDRFTGGVVDGGLFDEEPLFRGRVTLRLELRAPRPGELGLLLLVLKDLVSGDLPLGGGAAVGRGVMAGKVHVHLPGQEPHSFDPLLPAEARTVEALNRAVEEFRTAPVMEAK
jgi:CRISPR/Cas system CMR subunit Cmr4 (Cas7 group RAMP superfamily)